MNKPTWLACLLGTVCLVYVMCGCGQTDQAPRGAEPVSTQQQPEEQLPAAPVVEGSGQPAAEGADAAPAGEQQSPSGKRVLGAVGRALLRAAAGGGQQSPQGPAQP